MTSYSTYIKKKHKARILVKTLTHLETTGENTSHVIIIQYNLALNGGAASQGKCQY